MAMWVRTLLFAVGLVIAVTGGAYMTGLFNPWAEQPAEVVASSPEAASNQTQQNLAANDEATGDAQQTQPDSADVKQERLPAPGFDILRVEPDGSVLVAGIASGLAKIEILNGNEVLANTTANADGQFVIVLDKPLVFGDYALSLRSTSPDGEITTSTATAIISIPQDKNGPVLAMVEEPGAASQLVTVPITDEEQSSQSDQQAVADANVDAAVNNDAQQDVAAAGEIEAETGNSVTQSQDQPQGIASSDIAASDGEPANLTDDTAASGVQEQAIVSSQAATSNDEQNNGSVVVEAVEIEGNKIFVAGHAAAGRTVRVYAGNDVLGDAQVSANGRFLVEAQRDLAVGDYMIRADLLGSNGSVIARAAVPFTRAAGEAVSAVALAPSTQSNSTPSNESAAASAAVGDNATDDATAPRLQRVDGSVIIRRGDTLWHISRRVYGKGLRYSTIYLANQDQIRDPDLIWPGQVFALPLTTEQGEEADLDAIGDRNQ